MNNLVSFIIPTLNRHDDLKETIQMLDKQNYRNYEIIIVDNNSSDNTNDIFKEYKNIKYYRLNENIGCVAGRNYGFSRSKGDIIIFLDDDSFPGKNSISKTMEIFLNNPDVGVITFNIKDYNTSIDEFEKYEKNGTSLNENYYWSGCGGAFKREILEKEGLLDEWGMESPYELSISAKAIRLGLKCVSNDEIFVFHKWSGKGDPAEFRTSQKNFFIPTFKSYIYYLFKYSNYNLFFMKKIIWLFWCATYNSINKLNLSYIVAFSEAILSFRKIKKKRQPLKSKDLKKVLPSFVFLGH